MLVRMIVEGGRFDGGGLWKNFWRVVMVLGRVDVDGGMMFGGGRRFW